MFKRTYYLAGCYVLNQRVFSDMWQPYYREEVYRRAKGRLDELYKIQNDNTDRNGLCPPFQTSSLTLSRRAAGDGGVDSIPPVDALHSYSPDDENNLELNALSSSPSVSNLPMYEINGIVGTFLSCYNAEDLSATLQYIRERLGMDICSFHYNALFRIFNYGQDKDSVMQLMDLMVQRGAMTLEAYARAIDCIHCLAPADSLDRILTIVRLAQEAFGTLVFEEVSGSEAATVSAYRAGAPLGPEDGCPPSRSCPVLTALLHHVSVANDAASPIAALLIAVWVRALGVRLSDWDYVSICTTLLTRVETFPRVCRAYSIFSDFPTGSVSPQMVFERLRERHECVSPLSMVCRLVEVMRDSLEKAGVDFEKPVEVGVVNTRTIGLQSWINEILKYVVFHERGLGSRRYNAAVLYHILSLLYSTVRDDKSAVDVLLLAAEHKEHLSAQTQGERTHPEGVEPIERLDASFVPSATDGTMCWIHDRGSHGEPFSISFQHIQDVGSLLPRLSQRTRHDLYDAYNRLVQDVVQQYKDGKFYHVRGLDTLSEPATSASTSDAAPVVSFSPTTTSNHAVVSLLSPPHPLSASDVAGCEGYTLGVMHPTEAARKVLHRLVAQTARSKSRTPREVQLFMRQLAQYCCTHPLRNCKLTPTGLEERIRWGKYLDARDTSLALFGSGQHAREYMKQLYYNENRLIALRSEEMIMQDITEVTNILFPANSNSDELPSPSIWRSSSVSEARQWASRRTTLPHIRCSPHLVPPHLYDPHVYNPYPHVALKIGPIEMSHEGKDAVSTAHDASDSSSTTDDLFAELWSVLMNSDVMGRDLWYLRNAQMYMLLMRCLLHRLDWEAAAHLTIKMQEHTTYTYLMDHELTTIFKEIGDPAGCLAFKVATGLFDGRIMQDGQSKRKQFHQE
ncbi:unnamed protein product [Phytomonas sp. EM1]|nr:unnamed protein product [Phytomonas sp. EM1]|eukprot:CCW61700.1 unnamed protein product [Phytomonas sp. isolate EM1]